MCCKIDLNSQADAVHFLGKNDPKILPKTADNVSLGVVYADAPAMSLFDKWRASFLAKTKAQPQKEIA